MRPQVRAYKVKLSIIGIFHWHLRLRRFAFPSLVWPHRVELLLRSRAKVNQPPPPTRFDPSLSLNSCLNKCMDKLQEKGQSGWKQTVQQEGATKCNIWEFARMLSRSWICPYRIAVGQISVRSLSYSGQTWVFPYIIVNPSTCGEACRAMYQ